MELINSKITRANLSKRIYEPYESITILEIKEENADNYYDEMARILAQICLIVKGESNVKENSE